MEGQKIVMLTQEELNRAIMALTKDWDDWSDDEEDEMNADLALALKLKEVMLAE